MALTIRKTVQDFMNKFKEKNWFPNKFKYKEHTGNCKNVVYHFEPGVKDKATTAHYLASSGNVSEFFSFLRWRLLWVRGNGCAGGGGGGG